MRGLAFLLLALLSAASCSSDDGRSANGRSPVESSAATPAAGPASTATPLVSPAPAAWFGIGPGGLIEHVVFIIKENRSFNHYFGTYPGAAGTTH